MTTKQARYRARQAEIDPVGLRDRERAAQATFRHNHPEKKSAWNHVYRAIRSGRLVRPNGCERCGQECRPEASHDDYLKPLEVEWLCKTCHSKKDTLLRKGA